MHRWPPDLAELKKPLPDAKQSPDKTEPEAKNAARKEEPENMEAVAKKAPRKLGPENKETEKNETEKPLWKKNPKTKEPENNQPEAKKKKQEPKVRPLNVKKQEKEPKPTPEAAASGLLEAAAASAFEDQKQEKAPQPKVWAESAEAAQARRLAKIMKHQQMALQPTPAASVAERAGPHSRAFDLEGIKNLEELPSEDIPEDEMQIKKG